MFSYTQKQKYYNIFLKDKWIDQLQSIIPSTIQV